MLDEYKKIKADDLKLIAQTYYNPEKTHRPVRLQQVYRRGRSPSGCFRVKHIPATARRKLQETPPQGTKRLERRD